MIFVGDDWAEDHHDVHLMDDNGARLASRRPPEGLVGIGELHELLAGHAQEPGQVVVGIETDRGLWVSALSAAGYQVYAINPLAAARYRDRHGDGRPRAAIHFCTRIEEHSHTFRRAVCGRVHESRGTQTSMLLVRITAML